MLPVLASDAALWRRIRAADKCVGRKDYRTRQFYSLNFLVPQ
jgi:hypothetical protein